MSHAEFVPEGVVPATLLAFNEDFSIDEKATRSHLSDVASVKGVRAIVVNGHASEVHACTFDEQRQLVDMAMDEIGDHTPIVSGIYADGSAQAGRIARMAQDAGAKALLVFPSAVFGTSGMSRPEMIMAHFRAVADNSDLPLIIFQYGADTPLRYPVPIIEELLDTFPQIVGIKDASYDAQTHEHLTRILQARSRPVTMYTSHSGWLLGSLAMGANGILSGSGSVIAQLHVELFEAVKRGDLKAAREVNDRIYPTVRVFYGFPLVDMHNRMKEALVMLGKLDRAVVRAPLMKLPAEELERTRRALVDARLLNG
jgi:4-hydroxy-tetrahydrodipicolinate synthase